MTKLCVPITASTCEQMSADITAAVSAGAEIIELRVDHLSELAFGPVHRLLADTRQLSVPVIVTCRTAREGGQFVGSDEDRTWLFEASGRTGVEFIDVEYDSWQKSKQLRERIETWRKVHARSAGYRLIFSAHDFDKTPDDLAALLAAMAAEPCDVVKVACKATAITDSLSVLDALRASTARKPTIALAMGEAGLITRVLARKYGAFLTFASLETGKESAPGQVSIRDMRELYRWDAIREDTEVYGVIGCPVGHSMSPAMFNAAFTETGRNAVYLPLRVEAGYEVFEAFIDGVRARPWLGMRGFSVTIPHKENLLRYVERHGGEIEPLAKRIGVANTLVLDSGSTRLTAYNTDYRGAMDALCAGLAEGAPLAPAQAPSAKRGDSSPAPSATCPGVADGRSRKRGDMSGLRVAVLGAGGAARAIVAGLRDAGCEVVIYNRTHERAEALAAEFGCQARPWEGRAAASAEVVVNCTSIGMWPKVDETPLPSEALSARPAVFDTVYNPLETRLLREAREAGCKTIEGLGMLVNQAAHQYRLWTGQAAPTPLMDRIARERLTRK